MSGGGDDPAHLYKYRSLEGDARERTRKIIADNTLWFSPPADFNDPFDCSPVLSMQASEAVTRGYLKTLIREKAKGMTRVQRRALLSDIRHDPGRRPASPQFIANLREASARSVNQAGILSLSARPDQVLMWSHYAASHAGICLRFNRAPWAFPFRAAQKVIYSAQRPVLNPITDDASAQVDKAILTKADAWAYEEEWRVVSHPGGILDPVGGRGLVRYEPRALDGIILGARTSDTDAAEVARWVEGREHPVEILRARPNADRFQIDIVQMDAPTDDGRSIQISGLWKM